MKKSLPIPVQQALDIVRVTGNNAVHTGIIEIGDVSQKAHALFGLVNFICNHFITSPQVVEGFYKNLPEKDIKNIQTQENK